MQNYKEFSYPTSVFKKEAFHLYNQLIAGQICKYYNNSREAMYHTAVILLDNVNNTHFRQFNVSPLVERFDRLWLCLSVRVSKLHNHEQMIVDLLAALRAVSILTNDLMTDNKFTYNLLNALSDALKFELEYYFYDTSLDNVTRLRHTIRRDILLTFQTLENHYVNRQDLLDIDIKPETFVDSFKEYIPWWHQTYPELIHRHGTKLQKLRLWAHENNLCTWIEKLLCKK